MAVSNVQNSLASVKYPLNLTKYSSRFIRSGSIKIFIFDFVDANVFCCDGLRMTIIIERKIASWKVQFCWCLE